MDQVQLLNHTIKAKADEMAATAQALREKTTELVSSTHDWPAQITEQSEYSSRLLNGVIQESKILIANLGDQASYMLTYKDYLAINTDAAKRLFKIVEAVLQLIKNCVRGLESFARFINKDNFEWDEAKERERRPYWGLKICDVPTTLHWALTGYGRIITDQELREPEYPSTLWNQACVDATTAVLGYRTEFTRLMGTVTHASNTAIETELPAWYPS